MKSSKKSSKKVDKRTTSKKLYALPFGDDDTTGDSQFDCCNLIEYTESMTQEELVQAAINGTGWACVDCKEDFEQYTSELEGYWIIDEETKELMDEVNCDGGDDSEGYAANSTAKRIAKKRKIKTIKYNKSLVPSWKMRQ